MFLKKISTTVAYSIVAGLGLMVVSTACNKKKNDEPAVKQETTSYANEQLMLEQIYDNADRVADRAFSMGSSALGNCVQMWTDTTANKDMLRLTINFGNSNCLGYDGRYRKGKIIIEYNKGHKRNAKDYYCKMIFDKYVLDGYVVAGYREIWCKGENVSGNILYEIESVDSITTPDNQLVVGTSLRKRELYEGVGTISAADDKYRITGSGNFTGANKVAYSVEIVRPLVDALDCNWINQGVINIYPQGATQRVLDFGEGQCESDATINVNGVITKVRIP